MQMIANSVTVLFIFGSHIWTAGVECEEAELFAAGFDVRHNESEHQLHNSLTVEPGAVSFT